jgi:hypothetical protein
VKSCAIEVIGFPTSASMSRHKVVGHRVGVGMAADVPPHARTPRVGAHVALEHADHGLALLIRDDVEGLVGLLHRLDALDDGVGGGEGVALEGLVAAGHRLQGRVPFGMQLLRGAPGHPGGEAFVEPEVVPPGHGHEVAEPLVRDLVGRDLEDALAVLLRRDGGIDEQRVFEGEDRPPVLHGSEETGCGRERRCCRAWAGDTGVPK